MRAATSSTKLPVSKKRKVQVTDPSTSPKRKKDAKGAGKPVVGPSKRAVAFDVKGKGKEVASSKIHGTVTVSDPVTPSLPTTFKIVAGSYEKLLYGLEASFLKSGDDSGSPPWQLHLKPIFIFPAHVSCVKAVAASPAGGKWLATGSADEIIKVWDLRRRKEIGGLMHHEGSITYLTFPSRSHLISASEDGTLCLFRARDWAVLRTLKGHKGRINCVGVHPSGKLALSVGKDRTMRMWDLMRGKGSASTKLGKEGEIVCWSPSGARFAVQALTTIDIFTTNMALLYTITHPSRVHDVKFFRPTGVEDPPELLLVAAENKKVSIYELFDDLDVAPKVIAELVGHSNRVKAVDTLTVAIPPYSDVQRSATYASTVSSDGFIRVYDLGDVVRGLSAHATEQPVIIEPVAQYDTKGSRLTCVTMGDGQMVDGPNVAGGKRKRLEEDIQDDGTDDWPSEAEVKTGDAEQEDDAEDGDSD